MSRESKLVELAQAVAQAIGARAVYVPAPANAISYDSTASGLSAVNVQQAVDELRVLSAVQSVQGKTGSVVLQATDLGLGNVNNTADVNKPVSVPQQTALDLKLNKTGGVLTGLLTLSGSGQDKIALRDSTNSGTGFNIALNSNGDLTLWNAHTTAYQLILPVDGSAMLRGGWKVWDAQSFDPTTKASLSGATFTGSVSVPSDLTVRAGDSVSEGGQINLLGAGTNTSVYLDNYSSLFRVFGGSADPLTFDINLGRLTVSSLVVNGQTWATSLTLASHRIFLYEVDSSGTFGVRTGTTGSEKYFSFGSDGTFSATNGFVKTQKLVINGSTGLDYLPSTGSRYFIRSDGVNSTFDAVVADNSAFDVMRLRGTDLRFNGQTVWHAGNFNPATKANLAGPTFTGSVNLNAALVSISSPLSTIANAANNPNPGLVINSGAAGGTGDAAYINFIRQGNYGVLFGLDSDNQLKVGGGSMSGSYRIWHEGIFNPASKANLSGDNTYDGQARFVGSGEGKLYLRNSTATKGYYISAGPNNSLYFYDDGAPGTIYTYLNSTHSFSGNVVAGGVFYPSGAVAGYINAWDNGNYPRIGAGGNYGFESVGNPAGPTDMQRASYLAAGAYGGGYSMKDNAGQGVYYSGMWAASNYMYLGVTSPGSKAATSPVSINSAGALTASALTTTGNILGANLIAGGWGNGAYVQIGDDAKLVDVGVAHTVAVQSTTDANVGYIRFGGMSGYFGWDGSRLRTNGIFSVISPNGAYFEVTDGGSNYARFGWNADMSVNGSGWAKIHNDNSASITVANANGASISGNGGGLQFNGNFYISSRPNVVNAAGNGWVTMPRIFVQAGDPGNAASDGDLWIW